MAAITLLRGGIPTQITLATTVPDTITVPAESSTTNAADVNGIVVWNLNGATALRVTAGPVGGTLDPAGGTATIIAAGKSAAIPVMGGSSGDPIEVKVVGSANVYAVGRTDEPVTGAIGSLSPRRAIFQAVDHASIAAAAGLTTAYTVYGAMPGDIVHVVLDADLQGMTCTGYVSAANTVQVRLQNGTAAAIDLAATTVRIHLED